ncbi:MAG: hypothetical protein ABIO70_21365 [Pseudomonadota bacterium]
MDQVARSFADGGTWMYAVIMLDVIGAGAMLVSWIVALWGRFRGRTSFLVRAVPALCMIGAALPAVVGAIGSFEGRAGVVAACANVPPDQRAVMLAAGLQAAMGPLRFGGTSTLVLGTLAVIALMVAPWQDRRR